MKANKTCPVCGSKFQVEEYGRGRPKVYCSKDCRDLENYSIVMDKLIQKIEFQPKNKERWIATIMSIRNQF